jgi:hypothetical protein
MVSRWTRFSSAMNRWPQAHPRKWSVCVGVLMFLVGWWGSGRPGNRLIAGAIWGLLFFAVTAVSMRRGPGGTGHWRGTSR